MNVESRHFISGRYLFIFSCDNGGCTIWLDTWTSSAATLMIALGSKAKKMYVNDLWYFRFVINKSRDKPLDQIWSHLFSFRSGYNCGIGMNAIEIGTRWTCLQQIRSIAHYEAWRHSTCVSYILGSRRKTGGTRHGRCGSEAARAGSPRRRLFRTQGVRWGQSAILAYSHTIIVKTLVVCVCFLVLNYV